MNIVSYVAGPAEKGWGRAGKLFFACALTLFRSLRFHNFTMRDLRYTLVVDREPPRSFARWLSETGVGIKLVPFQTYFAETCTRYRGAFYVFDVMQFVSRHLDGVSVILDTDVVTACPIPVESIENTVSRSNGVLTVNPYHRAPSHAVRHGMAPERLREGWNRLGLDLPRRELNHFDYWSGGEFFVGNSGQFAEFLAGCRKNLPRFQQEPRVRLIKGPFDGNEFVISYTMLEQGLSIGGALPWCDRLHASEIRRSDGIPEYALNEIKDLPFWHLPTLKQQLAQLHRKHRTDFRAETLNTMMFEKHHAPSQIDNLRFKLRLRWAA